jgi:hypothetical protein
MKRKFKKNKKPPQRLPKEASQQLQADLDKRLCRLAQLEFAEHYYNNYMKALQENHDSGFVLQTKHNVSRNDSF